MTVALIGNDFQRRPDRSNILHVRVQLVRGCRQFRRGEKKQTLRASCRAFRARGATWIVRGKRGRWVVLGEKRERGPSVLVAGSPDGKETAGWRDPVGHTVDSACLDVPQDRCSRRIQLQNKARPACVVMES